MLILDQLKQSGLSSDPPRCPYNGSMCAVRIEKEAAALLLKRKFEFSLIIGRAGAAVPSSRQL